MKETYDMNLVSINHPKIEDSTCICLKTNSEEKFKMFLNYLQKNQMKRTLVIIRDKNEAQSLSRQLKLKSLTSYHMFESLSCQDMGNFSSPDILYRFGGNESKVMQAVSKSKNYNITISRYFDAIRFANFDCIVFYSFFDVPKFIEYCPDAPHRLALLSDDDFYRIRN